MEWWYGLGKAGEVAMSMRLPVLQGTAPATTTLAFWNIVFAFPAAPGKLKDAATGMIITVAARRTTACSSLDDDAI